MASVTESHVCTAAVVKGEKEASGLSGAVVVDDDFDRRRRGVDAEENSAAMDHLSAKRPKQPRLIARSTHRQTVFSLATCRLPGFLSSEGGAIEAESRE